jgi:RsiW-degrading membrane proteinase PrsW (M82 family)
MVVSLISIASGHWKHPVAFWIFLGLVIVLTVLILVFRLGNGGRK